MGSMGVGVVMGAKVKDVCERSGSGVDGKRSEAPGGASLLTTGGCGVTHEKPVEAVEGGKRGRHPKSVKGAWQPSGWELRDEKSMGPPGVNGYSESGKPPKVFWEKSEEENGETSEEAKNLFAVV
jgi:hypothetical protein